ncbi:MAG: carbon storage regulator [delta proteobacterium MLS_D]|jgi:carbon storage regulator|nr:MAG: carbon storage regulator [delta proteobacterium MLS_D]
MLVLTRKAGEAIRIGESVSLVIVEVKGNQVRVGIEAPDEIVVYREEIFRAVREQNTGSSFDEEAGLPTSLEDVWKDLVVKEQP